ncbi:MAG: hypothetical protein OXC66_04870 [Roseovarius sp.]|nr:hypothetical protein [Roseovarius sp.]
MDMGETPDNQELDKRLAVLEERMNTIHANLDATLNAFRVDAVNAKADAEKRDKNATRWVVGSIGIATALILAGLGISVTILGLWLG